LTVYTIGHSTRSLEELVGLLRAHGVRLLADVRTVPGSRRLPHFARASLEAELPRQGIGYVHLPELGGLRKPRPGSPNGGWRNAAFRGYADHMLTPEFRAGVDRLLELAAAQPTAVMCAEAVPWRCHRSLLADALLLRDVEVRHVTGPGEAAPHRLTPFAVRVGDRLEYPPAPGDTLPLDG
jgi:uncharacterized protein (DUF488 family)